MFNNFRKQFGLKNIKIIEEAASLDQEEGEFLYAIKKIIEEKAYLPEQVFNADESPLFWGRNATEDIISKEEKQAPGFKAGKDRITLLSCANAIRL